MTSKKLKSRQIEMKSLIRKGAYLLSLQKGNT